MRFLASPPGQRIEFETTWTLHVEGPAFLRGDCTGDGNVDISDAVCILNWLFVGEATPGCIAATNTNGDDAANITDATYLLNHLFAGGPGPAQPFPECGVDPTDDDVSCERPPEHCQP